MAGQKKFVGTPKSAMDFGWMVRAGKAINALLNGMIVSSQDESGHVIYSDANTVWKLPKSGGLNWVGNLDSSLAYANGSLGYVDAADALAATGIRDAANPSGGVVKSLPGYYFSIKDVPAQVTVSGNLVWNLPQWPLPAPSPAPKNSAANYWLYLGDICGA